MARKKKKGSKGSSSNANKESNDRPEPSGAESTESGAVADTHVNIQESSFDDDGLHDTVEHENGAQQHNGTEDKSQQDNEDDALPQFTEEQTQAEVSSGRGLSFASVSVPRSVGVPTQRRVGKGLAVDTEVKPRRRPLLSPEAAALVGIKDYDEYAAIRWVGLLLAALVGSFLIGAFPYHASAGHFVIQPLANKLHLPDLAAQHQLLNAINQTHMDDNLQTISAPLFGKTSDSHHPHHGDTTSPSKSATSVQNLLRTVVHGHSRESSKNRTKTVSKTNSSKVNKL